MTFKKLSLFAFIALVSFSACSQKKDSATDSQSPESAAASVTAETVNAENPVAELAASHTSEKNSSAKNGHREWYGFEEGIALSAENGKHVVIDFYTDWCKWCKVMDEETFSVAEVSDYLFEHFVPIRINAESDERITYRGKSYSYRELTSAFGVTGFPSLAYLTPNDELIDVIPGYVEKEPFMDIITYIAKECYVKQVPFENFRENGDCL